jgi:hypothetical protein
MTKVWLPLNFTQKTMPLNTMEIRRIMCKGLHVTWSKRFLIKSKNDVLYICTRRRMTSWKIQNKAKRILDHFGHLSLAKSQITFRFGRKMFWSCDVQPFTCLLSTFEGDFLLVDA